MKNESETLAYIHSLGFFSHPASLERITALLHALGDPQKRLRAIHIAGTNGKGSVAAYLASICRENGLKTGLFVSPYILNFRERIQLNGAFIPPEVLTELSCRVRDTGIAVTEFEFITAVAFLYFAQERCDIAVVETGLGGRLDATNTLTDTAVSVITKIGLDHTAILGDTLAQIAAEKCGIIKNEVTVTSPCQPPEALAVIRARARRLILPDPAALCVRECGLFGNRFSYRGAEYETVLGGEHQIENALTAIEAAGCPGLGIDLSAIQRGLLHTRFPARLEVLSRSPLIVLDGAHNPDGAEALCAAMRPYAGKITAVIGMMRDKNVDAFLRHTLPLCRRAVAVQASDSPRALSAGELAALASDYCADTAACGAPAEAARIALSADGPVFIFGSLYLASAMRPLLTG